MKREEVANDLKDVILTAVNSFPAISGAATKVLQLLNDPNTNVASVEETVRYDPGLTANILKLANSAYFGFSGKIGSVAQAVNVLGWKRMFQVVVASAMNAVLEKPVAGYDLAPGELWRHSVAVSVAAETLARQHKLHVPDETFTAALLHDVGKVVMGSYVAPFFDQIEIAASRGISFEAAEREVLGTDHAEIGACLLEHWSLPPTIGSAVRWHHDPDAACPTSLLIDLVHIADIFCTMLDLGVGRDGIQYRPSLRAMAHLGLKAEHLKSVAAQTLQGLASLGKALKAQAA